MRLAPRGALEGDYVRAFQFDSVLESAATQVGLAVLEQGGGCPPRRRGVGCVVALRLFVQQGRDWRDGEAGLALLTLPR